MNIYSFRLVFYTIFTKKSLYKFKSDFILTSIIKNNIHLLPNLILILTYHIYFFYIILVDEILEYCNDFWKCYNINNRKLSFFYQIYIITFTSFKWSSIFLQGSLIIFAISNKIFNENSYYYDNNNSMYFFTI